MPVDDILADVSRETMDKLRTYEALLKKWNKHIQVVSGADANHIWDRHILDSAQILKFETPKMRWLDVGTGGGFPGVVLAILNQTNTKFTFVERDKRKSAFLQQCIATLGLNAVSVSKDINALPSIGADHISARALASLKDLFELLHNQVGPGTCLILPKGRSFQLELDEARKSWVFDLHVFKSKVNKDSVILKVKDLHRV